MKFQLLSYCRVKKYFLLLIIFMACNQQSKKKITNKLTADDNLKIKLIGKWGDLENAGWDIRMDSIYYFERFSAYPYKIINNNFIIYLPESIGILKDIRVIKDTLFWHDELGHVVKAFRMK